MSVPTINGKHGLRAEIGDMLDMMVETKREWLIRKKRLLPMIEEAECLAAEYAALKATHDALLATEPGDLCRAWTDYRETVMRNDEDLVAASQRMTEAIGTHDIMCASLVAAATETVELIDSMEPYVSEAERRCRELLRDALPKEE